MGKITLSDDEVKEVITTYKTDRTITNKVLAVKYDVCEETIKRYTTGLIRDPVPLDDETHEEKLEKKLHVEYLQELDNVGITPKVAATALKKMFDSPDIQDVKEAVKEYHKVAGVYSKERNSTQTGNNSGVNRMMYNLKLPKRDEKPF